MLAAGVTAGFVDLKESLADHVPVMLAIVVVVTLTVLFAFTGSVVLPVSRSSRTCSGSAPCSGSWC